MFRDPVAQGIAAEAFRVLVVDDEPRLRQSFSALVSGSGHRPASCGSGAEALDRLRGEPFDLVLLDLNLPDMTGLSVMDAMAAAGIRTPVIVVSGEVAIDSAIAALRKGAYDFLRKPCEPEELLRTVGNALQRTHLERANREVHRRLRQSEEAYRFLVDNSPDIIYALDRAGCFSFLNGRAEALLGFAREQLVGRDFSTLVHDDDREAAERLFDEARAAGGSARHAELRLHRKGLPDDPSFITVAVDAIAAGSVEAPAAGIVFDGIYGVARDISERKRAEETIAFQAYHDALTGLPNRLLLKNRLDQALAQAARVGNGVAVMFLDLDRFKLINDTLGHLSGDELLRQVAGRIERCLRKGDTLARLGGDEFMLLLPQMDRPDAAAAVAQKILDELRLPFYIAEQELVVSASIGISVFPEDGDDRELLIRNADIAMYHVKWHGKNGYCYYSQPMNGAFHEKLALENDLRRALDRNEFIIRYQPQVDIFHRKIVGMEALIRWQHPKRGLLSPGVFIPLAEETGLITRISSWVLDEVCRTIASWRAAGLTTVPIAVNSAAHDIEQPDFVDQVRATLERHGIEPAGIEIEITESAIMRDVDNSVRKLTQLSEMGVMISVDDFGTRYSALNYLKKFPIRKIKIDQSFVRDLTADEKGTPIVAAIVAIARGFDLNLIAEGVECRRQLEMLHALECVQMQGYLFSEPVSVEQATAALTDPQVLFGALDRCADLFSGADEPFEPRLRQGIDRAMTKALQ